MNEVPVDGEGYGGQMTKPQTYLGRNHVDQLVRAVANLEVLVDRLRRPAPVVRSRLPWMRSCAGALGPGNPLIVDVDFTSGDGRPVAPNAKQIAVVIEHLQIIHQGFAAHEALAPNTETKA